MGVDKINPLWYNIIKKSKGDVNHENSVLLH